MTIDPDFAVERNLHDAGCDASTKDAYMQLHSQERTEEQLRLLRQHRKALLAKVHDNQKKIDCLDFLIFRLTRNGK